MRPTAWCTTVTCVLALAWSLMLSQAMESVTRAFYARGDLELILTSPAASERLFAVRIAAMAGGDRGDGAGDGRAVHQHADASGRRLLARRLCHGRVMAMTAGAIAVVGHLLCSA